MTDRNDEYPGADGEPLYDGPEGGYGHAPVQSGDRINMSKGGSTDGSGLPEGHIDLSKLGTDAELAETMKVIYAGATHHVPFIEYGTPVDYLKLAGIGVGLAGFFSGKTIKGTDEDGHVSDLKMRSQVPDDVIELAVAKGLWNG